MNNVYIPPPNGGMLDIAVAGLNAWDKNRRYQADQDRAQQEQEAGLLSKGLMLDRRPKIEDPNDPTGQTQIDNPDYNADHPRVVRDKVSAAAYQQNTNEAKVGTNESVQRVNFAKSLLGQILPQVPDPNDKTGKTMRQNPVLDVLDDKKISGTQARMYLDQFKPEIQAFAQIQARKPGNAMRQKSLDMRGDDQAVHAAESFDKDPLIQTSAKQLNQLGVDRHTLSTSKIIMPQTVHEIGAGMATILNQGKAVGLGQMELQDMGTSITKIAKWEQMLLNTPEEGTSPEMKQAMLDMMDRLEESVKKVQAARAKQLAVGKDYQHNPAAQKAVQEKVKNYSGQGLVGGSGKGLLPPNESLSPQDQQAVDWAKNNPNDPRSAKILQMHGM